ncbi:hypothetical protein C8A00DRAFT_29952 [Chaetomidium leptoderma]|uniref:SH3 domain-containing protein n=1 Tax=Chaetomidium leptoderma TaxID=669021 RepID=A0AAN6VVT1_9PEZI|nr:hypothetical protein C8A00DRAFT_29952 [Chaetomidium leptoderma]
MARPHIIRADTIDLQAHEAPSAQRHHGLTPDGSLAPHQAETLREVAAETAEENLRNPRVSWNPDQDDLREHALALDPATGGQQNGSADNMRADPQQDALAVAQNGGVAGHGADDGDVDGDAEVDMDDDMMDKISSSPSIEDGGSTFALPTLSSSRPSPLPQSATLHALPASPGVCDPRSSSPYLESPDHLPLARGGREGRPRAAVQSSLVPSTYRHHHHHLDGEFDGNANATAEDDASSETRSLPDDFDFDDSLLWADEEDDDSFMPGDMDNGNGSRIQGSIEPELEKSNDKGQGNDEDDDYDFDDLTVPYESDEEEDDDGDFPGLSDPRFIDSGWGGECLQDTEDIDFDFVYALHTFVATVEGQANATKGDTMVLLDDSNSYWWLVRVVKDSSIGYLPAEHIETPTERLARLNKHRNIDLSASMLGDQADKARNPIRTAMKRRKAKTVQFAAPTYVDYSDIDYSTEEEDAEGEPFAQRQQGPQPQQSQQSTGNLEMDDETAKVEPLKPKAQQKQAKAEKRQDGSDDTDSSSTSKSAPRAAVDEASDPKADGPKKTSDGTVRDSFFKDDTVETKKITLTPNLLRDDNAARTSTESREVKQRPSLDKLDKDSVFSKDDKKKKKDKEKDKKPGGLRGFFSRKDKKTKGDDDDDSFGKRSMDADAPEKDMEEDEAQAQPSPEKAGPQRQPSKLQKQHPRTEPSPTRRSNSTRENGMDVKSFLTEPRVNNVANVPPASMRVVDPSPKASPEPSPRGQRPDRDLSPVKSALSKTSKPEPRPAKSTLARSHVELDDFDSDEDITPDPTRQAPLPEEVSRQQTRAAPVDPSAAAPSAPAPAAAAQTASGAPAVSIPPPQQSATRLSESPVQVSPIHSSHPPPLMVDNSSQEEDRVSPRSTPSPELIEHDDADTSGHPKKSTTPSTTRSESWDDASLRAFFDSGSDIRDLLVVVYDKNNVESVGSDHPVAGSLFREQNAKLAEITTRLDDMLGDWLARKQRLRGSV